MNQQNTQLKSLNRIQFIFLFHHMKEFPEIRNEPFIGMRREMVLIARLCHPGKLFRQIGGVVVGHA